MPMYDELEQLRKLSRSIELEAMAKPDVPEEEEDFSAIVQDSFMDDRPYDPNPKVATYVVQGSSGTPNKKAEQKPAIFEQEPEETDADKAFESGLGMPGIGRALRDGLNCNECNECMDMCDPNCDIKFTIGDYVKPTCCETPVILVVKCTDGSNIMAAKPTCHADECSECGCWPEFSFEQDEIEPMEGITLDDIFNVMKFNDQPKTESFNGGCYDEEPMKAAQKGVSENQRDKETDKFKDINEFMEDVFGPVKDYTVKQKISPDQPEEQRVKFGFNGAL